MYLNLLLDVDPDQLTEDEKDNFCQTLARGDTEKLTDVHTLKSVVKLLQALLVYKVEQVNHIEDQIL